MDAKHKIIGIYMPSKHEQGQHFYIIIFLGNLGDFDFSWYK
jgi:hypothetical protein